jgi:membrane-bound serine protease (ClpP class)
MPITDPNLAFVLLVFGVLCLFVEFSAPGIVIPGVTGGILLLLGVSALSAQPVDWTGPALLGLAVACFLFELKFTTHGALGIVGMAAMIFGALILRVSLSTALLVSVPFGLITIFLASLAIRARRNKSFTGVENMIHEVGLAATTLNPEGQILIRGEYWTAISPLPVQPGAKLRVTAVHGLRLEVEPWV